MVKNYFKTGIRSLLKNKLFSSVNILGLALGVTASIFILQYALFELSYDRFHSAHGDIYRVMNNRYEGERLIQSGQITYSAVGPQMAEDYPEILRHTTVNSLGESKVRYEDQLIQIDNGFFVHESFFEMFDFELLAGQEGNLVKDLFTIVLTESVARKLFDIRDDNFESVVGSLILLDQDETPTKVTGVIKDAPANSHLQFQALASRNTLISFWSQAEFNWLSSDFFHYLQLVPGTDPKALEAKFEAFSEKYFRGDEVTGTFEKFHLQALDDVHLYSDYEYEIGETGNGSMVWALVIIAGFILLMAWINYINLTTSRAIERAREVGVRKVIGAGRKQLITQFLTETALVNGLALLVAFTFIQLLQSMFNGLVEMELSLFEFISSSYLGVPVWLLVGGTLLFGAFLSGIYPALIMSSYSASRSLKYQGKGTGSGPALRKALVLFQFCISTVLIAGTILVYRQVNFMRAQDLGMNIDQVMLVEGPSLTGFDSTFIARIQTFKTALKQSPQVIEVATSSNVVGERLPRVFNASVEGMEGTHMLNRMNIDFGFVHTYEIGMVAGRSFEPNDHKTDGDAVENVMLNRQATELLGFSDPSEAVNKRIRFWGRNWFIIGVTDDFHNRSLQKSIEPIVFVPFYSPTYDRYHVRLSGTNIKETIAYVESTYNSMFPGNIFRFSFMDESFDRQYRNDELFGQVFQVFSLLAILIACLGLFGLAGYSTILRTKEIGIRKALGASVSNIVRLLSLDFLKLIFVAGILAMPLVYLGANRWLNDYAFHIPIEFGLFIIPLMIVVLVAVVTISFHSINSARRNPVDSLRYE